MNNSRIFSFWAIFAFFALCYAFIYFVFPTSLDDWSYWAEMLNDGIDENGHHTTFMGIREGIVYRYNYDVSRIGNTLGFLILYFPKWVRSILPAFFVTWGFWEMLRLSFIKPGQSNALIALFFLFTFGLMWHEGLFSHMYFFNYIIIIPLYIYAIRILISDQPRNKWLCLALGIVVGCWHETYGLSLIVPGVLIVMLRRKLLTPWRICLILGGMIGFLWIIIFPAAWVRAFTNIGLHAPSYRGLIRLLYLWPQFIAILLVVYKYIKKLPVNRLDIAMCGAGLVMIPLAISSFNMRADIAGVLLSICTILRDRNIWIPRFARKSRFMIPAVCAIAFIFTAVHLIAVCRETVIYRRITDQIALKLWNHEDEDGLVYSELRHPWETSPLALQRPEPTLLTPPGMTLTCMRFFYEKDEVFVIPIELKDYKRGEGDLVDAVDVVRNYNGHLVSENLSDTVYEWGRMKYDNFEDVAFVYKKRFKTHSGDQFVYILPMRSTGARYSGRIKGISYDTGL